MIIGVAVGCGFALLVVWSVVDYSRPLMYRGSGLGAVSVVLALVMAAEIVALFHCSGLQNDLSIYRGWAIKLAHGGPAVFYPPGYGYDGEYAPASVYPLWLSGAIGAWLRLSREQLRLPIEIPQIVISFALAESVFAFLWRSGFSQAKCWIGAMLVALNPPLVFDAVVWGQTDALVMLLMWLMVVMTIDGRYEFGAALAAAAVMAKPHPIVLLPMLTLWLVWYARPLRWCTAAASFAATIAVLAMPFAVRRPIDWLPRFYLSSLSYFRETSLNAFNFMALTGGLRQNEAGALMGVTYFELGMALASGVLVFSVYLLWRYPTSRGLMLAAFIALFGNFIFAPRMHERYLCPALIFLVPAALEMPWMAALFVALTLSALFNLDYVFGMLRTTGFFASHDPLAMAASVVNLILFIAAAAYAASIQAARELIPEPGGPRIDPVQDIEGR